MPDVGKPRATLPPLGLSQMRDLSPYRADTLQLAPNGTRYPNRKQFPRIEQARLIEIDHGADKDAAAGMFRVTVTFDQQSDGKTVITMRPLHPTRERDATIGFGAVEFGYQTFDKLSRHAIDPPI